MNKITLLLVVVIIGLTLFLINYFVSDIRQQTVGTEVDRGILVKEIRADSIDAISLKKGSVAINLVKKDKDWIMPLQKNRTAKTDRITKLVSDIQKAYSKGPRPGNKATEYAELTPELRTELTLEGEGKKLTLFVGKNLPESGSFVQRDASGLVLEVDQYLATSSGVREEKGAMILDPAFFYDLKIFNDSTDDAIDVVIKKGNEVFRVQQVLPGKGPVTANQKLEKDEKPIWWVTEPEGVAADENKVRSICSTMLNLTGKGYADDVADKDRGFDKPTAKIAIRLKDGGERSMTFGKIDNDDVLVSAVGKADAFKVNKYVYDTCSKTDELRKKEEKKEEPVKIEEPAKPAPPIVPKPEEKKPVPVIPAPPK